MTPQVQKSDCVHSSVGPVGDQIPQIKCLAFHKILFIQATGLGVTGSRYGDNNNNFIINTPGP